MSESRGIGKDQRVRKLSCLQNFGLYINNEANQKPQKVYRSAWCILIAVIGISILAVGLVLWIYYDDISLKLNTTETINAKETPDVENSITSESISGETSDVNAEMLIAIPDIPSPYLVPPPFPPPYSVLIKRRPSAASRRHFDDSRTFPYARHKVNRLPVNSIQDILNQMERESTDYERIAQKRPKRINFYGRYRHRPNRPKVIPIPSSYGNAATQPVRENPSVANDVNHLITQNQVPQREPTQLFYPNPSTTSAMQSNGLYDQIIATNKYRHETAKDAKPFSLMLDIYPMPENQTTTTFPPPPPPKLPPLQIDHSYYNSIKFPQIHPTHMPVNNYHSQSVTEVPRLNEQPEKMVVHLNLYPTKKNKKSNNLFDPDPNFFVNEQGGDNDFMPIMNPQIYYRSRSTEDESNQAAIQEIQKHKEVVNIPKHNQRPLRRYPGTGIPRVQVMDAIRLGPAINVTDYRTTIPPHLINRFLYEEEAPRYTYLGNFNSNEIGRRADVQEVSTTLHPDRSTSTPTTSYQRNSHQPDNPMVVENLWQYIIRSGSSTEKPSRSAISS